MRWAFLFLQVLLHATIELSHMLCHITVISEQFDINEFLIDTMKGIFDFLSQVIFVVANPWYGEKPRL